MDGNILTQNLKKTFEQLLGNSKFQLELVLFKLTKVTKLDSKVLTVKS